MPDQNYPDRASDNTPEQTLSPLIKAYIDEQMKEFTKINDHRANKSWKRAWRSASPITKATLGLTASVAVATIAYAFIAAYQLDEMKLTNSLTERALKQATQNSSDSSAQFQTQLGHFDAGLGRTELLAEHAGEQAAASKEAANAAKSAADTAKEALVDGQRAVVSADTFTVARQADKDGRIDGLQFTVGWKNSGNTTTERLETWSNWRPVPPEMRVDKNFDFTDTWIQSSNPVPHEHGFATSQKLITYYPMTIPRYLAEGVADGKVALLFWGRATYKDVFSKEVHTSEYCLTVVGFDGAKPFDTSPDAGITYPRFVSCPVHNCHDEECKAN